MWRRARRTGLGALATALLLLTACSDGDNGPDLTMEAGSGSSLQPTSTSTALSTSTTAVPQDGTVADCSGETAATAVEANVDGGLRSSVLACDGTWMAVDTSTNACAATGESMAARCRANHHVVYFRSMGGAWSVVAFDDCDLVRSIDPSLPPHICQ